MTITITLDEDDLVADATLNVDDGDTAPFYSDREFNQLFDALTDRVEKIIKKKRVKSC